MSAKIPTSNRTITIRVNIASIFLIFVLAVGSAVSVSWVVVLFIFMVSIGIFIIEVRAEKVAIVVDRLSKTTEIFFFNVNLTNHT